MTAPAAVAATVPRERAADQPQVGGPADLGAEHDPSRAGVAGDDIRQGER